MTNTDTSAIELSKKVAESQTSAAPEVFRTGGWYPIFKRAFDIFFATLGLLVLGPFGILIALAIKLTDRGPMFYRQVRVGQFGKPFRILKFRTMIVNADKAGPSVTKDGDSRITRVGRVLRKTKLDELPQLWNVLVGTMSFVGPRPEVPRYVDRYTPEQRQILQFKPGITDLATLVFRDEETLLKGATNVEEFYVAQCIPRKFNLNLQYARRANIIEDVLIILETLCPYWVGVASGYVIALAVSLWFSYQLRFDFAVPDDEAAKIRNFGLVVVPLQLIFLMWRRQFVGLLSYFDLPEMKQLANGLAQAAAVQFLVWYVTNGDLMPPRSVIVMNAIVAFVLIAGTRGSLRSLRQTRNLKIDQRTESETVRVGVVGAGELGAWLARQINARGKGQRKVVAFFDDDADKWNLRLCDVPVVGMPECILDGSWTDKLHEVVLAIPSASAERQKQIMQILGNANIRARQMPSLEELLTA